MTRALEGVRVLDLSRVWAGPYAAKILADLGAEVIIVVNRESIIPSNVPPEVAKIMGVFPDDDPGERPWNRISMQNDFGRGKLSLTLELNTDEGKDIFRRLVKISDVILENFSPRVMMNFGFDYPVLRELNPGIIMCSMPGYGLTGPYRDWVSYGTNLDPASGLSSLIGYPGEGPHLCGNAYPDPAASMHAVSAILTALFHRRRSGVGQHIDLSQAESASFLMGDAVLGYALNKKIPPRMGNHHPYHAPHNAYRCKGDDKWVAIAVTSDEEWQAMAAAMGNPAWAGEDRFSDQRSRLQNQDELDDLIQAWTQERTHYEVLDVLQKVGVPAGALLDAPELVSDPHLNQRGFFVEIDHPEAGRHKYCVLPIKFSETPPPENRPAPCLGEHIEYVLGDLLGLSSEEIAQLEEKDIIGREAKN
jgi:crotonobetainyl-CoA:carnitine CoA-transferase CaiB-like acyl-CoA transferase